MSELLNSGNIHYGSYDPKGAAPLVIDREEALSYLGYAGQEIDTELQERFLAQARACEQQTCPAYAWAPFDIDEQTTRWDAKNPQVVLGGCNLILPGADIAHHLQGACKVVLMACTLGAANERDMRRVNALSPADGTMYGACSSALVEACANAVEHEVSALAQAQGCYTKWRYSPGYGDLPLSVQPRFLQVLDAPRRLGLNVTKTFLMVPSKSVTAIVGVFDTPQKATALKHSCDGCQMYELCKLRSTGKTCRGENSNR